MSKTKTAREAAEKKLAECEKAEAEAHAALPHGGQPARVKHNRALDALTEAQDKYDAAAKAEAKEAEAEAAKK